MHDPGRISPLQRAALLATAITLPLTIGLLLVSLPHIVIAHRRPMLLQTRECSHINAPAQFLIHSPALCSALRTVLNKQSAVRPI
jgi:hypothetical protein